MEYIGLTALTIGFVSMVTALILLRQAKAFLDDVQRELAECERLNSDTRDIIEKRLAEIAQEEQLVNSKMNTN
jgi:hypothetical protein